MLGKTAIKPFVHIESYSSPPEMDWFMVYRNNRPAGEMLGCFELIKSDIEKLPEIKEIEKQSMIGKVKSLSIPEEIRPKLKKFRLEVIFWGIRQTKRIRLLSVKSPVVIIECGGYFIESTIDNMEKNANFNNPLKFIDIELPEDERFWPPITVRCIEKRKLGGMVFVGNICIRNLTRFKWSNMAAVEEKRRKKWKKLPEPKEEDANLNVLNSINDQESLMDQPSLQAAGEKSQSNLSLQIINETETSSLKKRNSITSLKSNGRRSLHSSKLQLPSIGEEGAQKPKDAAIGSNNKSNEELSKTVKDDQNNQQPKNNEVVIEHSQPPPQVAPVVFGQGQPHVIINLIFIQ